MLKIVSYIYGSLEKVTTTIGKTRGEDFTIMDEILGTVAQF